MASCFCLSFLFFLLFFYYISDLYFSVHAFFFLLTKSSSLSGDLQRLAGASLLVFANKSDVAGCMDEGEIMQGLRLAEIKTHQWKILRCSAMTGENLREGLAWVVEDAKARLFLY